MLRLTRTESYIDGFHCIDIELNGETHTCCDDFRVAIDVISAFEDDSLDAQDRFVVLVSRIFPYQEKALASENLEELIDIAAWECYGIDLSGCRISDSNNRNIIDWEEDAFRIKTSILSYYGVSWSEVVSKFGYRDICEMIGLIGHDTPMGQAMYYRTAQEPKRTRDNDEEISRFRKLRDFYALKGEPYDAYENMNNVAGDIFSSLARASKE